MSPRLAIATGLVAGVVVAVALVAALLAFAPATPLTPDPTARPSASPSVAASPSPTADLSPTPTQSPADGSPGPSPIGDPGSSEPAGSDEIPSFGVGLAAPPLTAPRVGGGTIDLAALKGKPVWLNFMGTYCPPCRDEFPLMNGFAARYADAGLVVVAVDVREDEGTVAAFADDLNTTFPIGLDEDGSLQAAWRTPVLPVHYWIDKDGIVRDGALGGIGPDIMARSLQKILPGVTVTVDQP